MIFPFKKVFAVNEHSLNIAECQFDIEQCQNDIEAMFNFLGWMLLFDSQHSFFSVNIGEKFFIKYERYFTKIILCKVYFVLHQCWLTLSNVGKHRWMCFDIAECFFDIELMSVNWNLTFMNVKWMFIHCKYFFEWE